MKHLVLARRSLGFFPTPFHELRNLTRHLNGPRIFIKRDDQTGLAFGGNKTRKLEFLVGAALAKGADTLVTAGAIQSNHCRQTAAAAAAVGMECHLVLGGSQPELSSGNLLLDRLLGAQIHWAGANRKGEDIPEIVTSLIKSGRRPYVIPYGGSNEIGAAAFVEAVCELERQAVPNGDLPDAIVFASSSGGTHAGLVLGAKLLEWDCRVVGIAIDKVGTAEKSFPEVLSELTSTTAAFLEMNSGGASYSFELNECYTGSGYGIVGDAEREAIGLTARLEGILLDPVYTGRAMAGLIDLVRKGCFSRNERLLFWHTGGTPALFAYASEL